MAKYDGKNEAFKFGSFTWPAGYLTTVDWPQSRAENDVTGATQLDKEFLTSERESTITVTAWGDVADTIRAGMLIDSVAGTAEYWPQGAVSGKPKRSASAFITSISDPLTHNTPAVVTVAWRVSGAVTVTTVSP